MKTLKKQLKIVALFFSALILLQGCTVYKSANVTLEEASKAEIQARVKTNDNQTQKFKRIGFENGQYYGVKKINGDIIKTQINEQKIKRVQLKDKTASTIIPIAVPVIIIGIAAIIFANNCCGFGSGSWSY